MQIILSRTWKGFKCRTRTISFPGLLSSIPSLNWRTCSIKSYHNSFVYLIVSHRLYLKCKHTFLGWHFVGSGRTGFQQWGASTGLFHLGKCLAESHIRFRNQAYWWYPTSTVFTVIINNKDLTYKVLMVFKVRLQTLPHLISLQPGLGRARYYAQFKDEITKVQRGQIICLRVREGLETRSPTFWIWVLCCCMLFHCLLNT